MSKNEKPSIGVIYLETYYDKVDRLLFRTLEKRLNVIPLPLEEQVSFDSIKAKTKNCKVILNECIWGPITFEGIELSKTLEELGKKVINSSHSFYYQEDKWMFYLKCLEHSLPTPQTFFIPKEPRYNSRLIKDILKNKQLVLKAAFSDNSKCVEKINSYHMFSKKIHQIIHKNPISPIIAQEFIPNFNKSYRATLINYHIKQFISKTSKSWKQKGDEKEHFRTIKINNKIKNLCEKASKIFRMEICGLDLIYNKGKWYIIEANSCPGLDFINSDVLRLTKILTNYLYSVSKKLG